MQIIFCISRKRESHNKEMKKIEANKRYRIKLVQLLTTILNLFLFGLSVAIFVIGILYLSAFYYKYSFSSFNPTVVAGIYVSFGLCIAFFSISNVICVNTDTKHKYLYLALSSFAIIILFVILLAIGIWGLSVYTDQDSLREEVKKTMYSSCLIYNNPSYNAEQTDKTNWLQTTFRYVNIFELKLLSLVIYLASCSNGLLTSDQSLKNGL